VDTIHRRPQIVLLRSGRTNSSSAPFLGRIMQRSLWFDHHRRTCRRTFRRRPLRLLPPAVIPRPDGVGAVVESGVEVGGQTCDVATRWGSSGGGTSFLLLLLFIIASTTLYPLSTIVHTTTTTAATARRKQRTINWNPRQFQIRTTNYTTQFGNIVPTPNEEPHPLSGWGEDGSNIDVHGCQGVEYRPYKVIRGGGADDGAGLLRLLLLLFVITVTATITSTTTPTTISSNILIPPNPNNLKGLVPTMPFGILDGIIQYLG